MSKAEPRARHFNSTKLLRSWPSQYAFAVLTVAAATALRFGLQRLGPFHSPFLLFYPAVVLVAMRAGFWPGIVATVLAAISGGYFFEEPQNTFAIRTVEDVIGPALFALVSVALTVLTASRNRARQELAVSQAELNRAQTVAHIGSWHFDLAAGTLRLSDEACRLLGLPLGTSLSLQQARQMIQEADSVRVAADWAAALQTGMYDDELRVQLDGRTRWVHVRAIVECDSQGHQTKAVGTVQDITEAKLTRERNEEFERVVEGVDDMIAVVDREYRYIIANHAFLKYRGAKKEDVIGRTIWDVVNADSVDFVKGKVDECFQGKVVQFDFRYRYPWGERDLFISYFPIEGPTGVERVASILQDLTEIKQAESELRASESRYRDLVEHSEDLVCTHDLEGRLLSVNPAPARLLGYEVAELQKIPMRELIIPERREAFDQYLHRLRTTGQPEHGLLCVMTRSGEVRTWEYCSSLRTEGVETPIVRGMAHDVTEKRRAELALVDSEQRYRMLFEKNIAGVAVISMDAVVLESNDCWAHMLGYDSGKEVCGRKTTEFYVDLGDRHQLLQELEQTGASLGREIRLKRKDGGQVWVLLNCAIRGGDDGQPMIQATAIDITERMQAEDGRKKAVAALRESEAHFRILVEQAMDGIFIADSQGRYQDVNSAGAAMLGYTRAEILARSISDVIAPQETPRVPSEVSRIAGDVIRSEWKFRRKDGSFFPGEVSGKRLPDGRLQGILRDMTERVQAEEALRASEQRMRLAQEVARMGTYERNLVTGEGRWSPEMEAIYGLRPGCSPKSIKEFLDLIHPEDRNHVAELLHRSMEYGDIQGEWRAIWPDGSVRWIAGRWRAFPDQDEKPVRAIGMDYDITERKQAEEALRKNEERFRVALKDSPITVFNQDLDLRYTWVYNPRSYWQDSMIGQTDEEILGPKALRLTALKRQVLETGVSAREEVEVPHNGANYAFDITIEPLFDADRKIVGITGAAMDIARLHEVLDRLQIAKEKLTQEKSYLESEIQAELGFEEIIGQSAPLRNVLKQARVVATTDSTVLLLGETGTGKELVARSIHSLSSRKDKNFIKLNCAAVPSGLLESELFGHEKGAFTGAVTQKAGRLELADKGTLFLDEIGELPPELQPKLLRVLQDREFERLGGVRTLKVDVRIISATNRDLQKDVVEKKFREDLFYRLNVFPIELPALRERRTDIPMLVHHFMRKHAQRMGKQIELIPSQTMKLLQKWNWPGNIRELENVLERMIILTKGPILAEPPSELSEVQEFVQDNLTEMEREHIVRILRETKGVLSGTDGAATRLGVKRTTLQSMLKRLGIEPSEYKSGTGAFGPH